MVVVLLLQVPPGGEVPFHDPKSIKAHDAANTSVMTPPVLNVEPYALLGKFFRAEDLPQMDASGATGSKCDAFGKLVFGGNTKTTEIITSQQPDWTQSGDNVGTPAHLECSYAQPVGGQPLCSDNIEFGIWDNDAYL
eukprot:SAG22_NODE_9748_length_572_cov_0.636364_1_plen_136_part_10